MESRSFIGCNVIRVLVNFRENFKNLRKYAKPTLYWFIGLRKTKNSSSLVI